MRCLYAGWAENSSLATKRVPRGTPSAPRRIAPEEYDGRHPLANRGIHLLARDRPVLVRSIALVDDEVDPERPGGALPDSADQRRHVVGKERRCADDAEAAGIGDRRSEIGA